MPLDKIYVSLGIKHVYFSNVAMEWSIDFKHLSCGFTATFWNLEELFSGIAILFFKRLHSYSQELRIWRPSLLNHVYCKLIVTLHLK